MSVRLVGLAKRLARHVIGRPIFGRSILVYHRIAKTDFDPCGVAVSPDEFERQLVRMRTKTVLPLDEFVKLHVRNRVPRNAVAITFDDGYACNALVAAPMLDAFGYPATFFIVSDAIARPQEFWWDQLERIFHAPGFDYDAALRPLVGLLSNRLSVAIRADGVPHAAFLRLWELLHRLSAQARRQYLADLRAAIGLKKEMRLSHRPMTATELRRIAANPLFDIGGHTATHPSLPRLAAAEQEQEIVSGVQFLEVTTGKPIRSFSYPFGDWEQGTRDIVAASGFECAVTMSARRVRPGDNRFELPRRRAVMAQFWPSQC
jgi:peptidoglycan/xylan/chitin deacetylase (PgdA/CDA1 family)